MVLPHHLPLPGPFFMDFPMEGANNQSTILPLDWEDSTNAAAYDLYLGITAPPGPVPFQAGLLQSHHKAYGLTPNQQYYWSVNAKNVCGTTESSLRAYGSFTTTLHPESALEFDGTDDQISLLPMPFLAQGTIELWFRPGFPWQAGSPGMILMEMDPAGGSDGHFVLGFNRDGLGNYADGRIRFQIQGDYVNGEPSLGSVTLLSTTAAWQAGTWYHLGVTWNGAQAVLYINGTPEDAKVVTSGVFHPARSIYLGYYRSQFLDSPLDGALDELRIWSAERGSVDILQDMCNELVGDEAGLLAYWRMDENGGQILADLTGHGYGGTLGTTAGADPEDPAWFQPGIDTIQDRDNDGISLCEGDCDDANGQNYPGNVEICDGQDNDCDTLVDEGCDDDNDDWCDAGMTTIGNPATCPNGGGDCNDGNPAIHPGATEVCDDLDNDCDTLVDEGCDDDNDDWCDAGMTTIGNPATCPNGGGDCDDLRPTTYPGAPELCDNYDNDCDGTNNEFCDRGLRFADIWQQVLIPHDNSLNLTDQLTIEGWVNLLVYDGFPTIVDKGWTEQYSLSVSGCYYLCLRGWCASAQNCSYLIPLNEWVHTAVSWDGANVQYYINGDLIDTKPYSGTLEANAQDLHIGRFASYYYPYGTQNGRYDEIRIWNVARPQEEIRADMGCELAGNEPGLVALWRLDETSGQTVHDGSLQGNDGFLGALPITDGQDPLWDSSEATLDRDYDGDGWTTCAGDCDDADPVIHPSRPEVCDGKDNDCDGLVDEGFDVDGDGFTSCGGDCNDNDNTTFPGAPEICDTKDNDCDIQIDEDDDGDGYEACEECDNADPNNFPGNPEMCDGRDNDCDTQIDEGLGCDAGLYYPNHGADHFVSVSESPTLDLGSHFSMEMWMRSPLPGSAIVDKGCLEQRGGFGFWFYWRGGLEPYGYPTLCLGDDLFAARAQDHPIPLNEWFHAAVTSDGSTANFYINGDLIHSQAISASITQNNNALTLGYGMLYGRYYWGMYDERLDDVRIWNTVRTPTEIQENMRCLINESNPNLVGHWRFDEGAGQAIHDSSIYHNHVGHRSNQS
jgi:hypothetical protein